MNLPNKLTVSRCVMTLFFVGFMSVEHVLCYAVGYVLFVLACITDYYDGKIARERNLITNFGKLLDPIADKVLVVAALLIMMKIEELKVPAWTVTAILAREFLITGMRALAASDGLVIAANNYGKTKTLLQMIYVFVFLFLAIVIRAFYDYSGFAAQLPSNSHDIIAWIGYASQGFIILVAVYTVYSGVQYVRLNWKNLNLNDI